MHVQTFRAVAVRRSDALRVVAIDCVSREIGERLQNFLARPGWTIVVEPSSAPDAPAGNPEPTYTIFAERKIDGYRLPLRHGAREYDVHTLRHCVPACSAWRIVAELES